MQHFASATKKNTSQTALFIARIECKAIRCLCFRDVFHIILLKQSFKGKNSPAVVIKDNGFENKWKLKLVNICISENLKGSPAFYVTSLYCIPVFHKAVLM